jgi:Kef-type K+ transport system membrane component KefB
MSERKLSVGGLYLILTLGALLLYFGVRYIGLHLEAPARLGEFKAKYSEAMTLAQLMVALAVITLASRGLGLVCERWLNQPPVIGEILAGIMLGPSLLGFLAPSISAALFPSGVVPALSIISKVGVVLFMFVVGLEIDSKALRRSARATIAVSHSSIVIPFVLGSILALALYPRYATNDISFTAFSLFCGVSLSITAFPVLARLLKERGVQKTPFGNTVLACAAVDDVTAWSLLALVVAIATTEMGQLATHVPLLIGYFLLMFLVVRPLLAKLSDRLDADGQPITSPILTLGFVGVLLSSAATEFLGIHALFGAFFFGVFIPCHGRFAHALRERIEDLVGIVFLPAFFAFTGLRTQIGLVDTWVDWAFCGLIIATATLGKFGGSYIAARFSGLPPRESSALGVLMNTRGLIELIALNIGLDLGILSPQLFAMLVIMALVTTLMTSPLFTRVSRGMNFDFALTARNVPKEEAKDPPPLDTKTC